MYPNYINELVEKELKERKCKNLGLIWKSTRNDNWEQDEENWEIKSIYSMIQFLKLIVCMYLCIFIYLIAACNK
jgi:hypothetical protein